jgi:hypothetical protein
MRLQTKCVVVCVAAAVALIAQNCHAGRLIFSNSGPGGTPVIDTAVVPMAVVTPDAPGDTGQLHVWFLPEAGANYTGVSWNIVAAGNTAAIGTAAPDVSFTTANPPAAAGGTTRWSGIRNHTYTFAANGRLVNNAGGFYLPGLSPNPGLQAGNAQDAGFDPVTGAFHMGTLNFRGVAGGDVRLYLQVGQNTIARLDGTNNEPMFMGNNQTTAADNDTRNVGDDINDPSAADAIIRVAGGPPPVRPEIIQFTEDPNNMGPTCMFGPPSNVQPVNCAITPPNSMVKISMLGAQHDTVDLFFDLNEDNPAVLEGFALALTAQESDEGLLFARVIPNGENTLNLGIDYDIQLQYTNTPGANRFFDVDASVVPGLVINNVAIPEPSTWVLVACGLLGLAMARRRRAA